MACHFRRILLPSVACLLILLPSCSRKVTVVAEDTDEVLKAEGPGGSSGSDSAGVVLPGDSGGKALSRILPPRDSAPDEQGPAPGPRAHAASRLALPAAPLPPISAAPPSLPLPTSKKPLRPHLVLEPGLDSMPDPLPPRRVSLPVAPVLVVDRTSPDALPDLPPLSSPLPDRESLDDVTAAASTAAALAAEMPTRTSPAPFLRLTVPDPYDQRRTVPLPILAEGPSPQATAPLLPGR